MPTPTAADPALAARADRLRHAALDLLEKALGAVAWAFDEHLNGTEVSPHAVREARLTASAVLRALPALTATTPPPRTDPPTPPPAPPAPTPPRPAHLAGRDAPTAPTDPSAAVLDDLLDALDRHAAPAALAPRPTTAAHLLTRAGAAPRPP
jgi:hypothetical protein